MLTTQYTIKYTADMKPLTPYCRSETLAVRDGRTREARLLKNLRAELVEHVGGTPSATQRALIETACQLALRISLMDRKFAETGTQTDHDSRTYLAWSSAYQRALTRIGVKPTDSTPVRSVAAQIAEALA